MLIEITVKIIIKYLDNCNNNLLFIIQNLIKIEFFLKNYELFLTTNSFFNFLSKSKKYFYFFKIYKKLNILRKKKKNFYYFLKLLFFFIFFLHNIN
jgi:hypothetical protein